MTLPQTDVQPPATPPGEGGSQGQQPPVDWEARYKSFQAVHQTVVEASRGQLEALTGEITSRDARLAQAEADNKALKSQLETAASQGTQVGTKITEVEKESKDKDTQLMRVTMLLDEFQDLKEFEKAGLLPKVENPTPESLHEAFAKFRTALGQVKQEGARDALGGTIPPAPPVTPGGDTVSKQDLLKQAQAASKKQDWETYDKLMVEVYKAT